MPIGWRTLLGGGVTMMPATRWNVCKNRTCVRCYWESSMFDENFLYYKMPREGKSVLEKAELWLPEMGQENVELIGADGMCVVSVKQS